MSRNCSTGIVPSRTVMPEGERKRERERERVRILSYGTADRVTLHCYVKSYYLGLDNESTANHFRHKITEDRNYREVLSQHAWEI